jgi:prepilin-type N-terminal cleavage/methylation domain-containing protein
MYSPRRRRDGFTLIELLVVIAVIALLIGILLPALGKARRSAQSAKNLANLKSLGLSSTLYANESKNIFPVMPLIPAADRIRRQALDGQYAYGGVAGLFSLKQKGDGSDLGFGGNTDNGSTYFGGNDTPLLRAYMDAFSILVNPADKEDRYYGMPYAPPVGRSYSNATVKQPKAPGSADEVVSYNISYLYIAGLKTDEPVMLTPVVLWGDETNGPDISTYAFYGGGGGGAENATQAGTTPGYYGPADNFGTEGGAYVFTDGHAAFLKYPPPGPKLQDVFFSTDTNRYPTSVNAVQRNRSNFVQTID